MMMISRERDKDKNWEREREKGGLEVNRIGGSGRQGMD